ncbi:MAG: NFACT family protein [Candidatus Micrarchaeia archaeon]
MLYGIELECLTNDLQRAIGYYVENFYEGSGMSFRLKLEKSGSTINMMCELPYALHIASSFEKAEEPTNFAIAMRRRIRGFSVRAISRLGSDRIIRIDLAKGEEGKSIIAELFGKGNLILVNSSSVIELAYIRHKFKDRSIEIGSVYELPKSGEKVAPAHAGSIAERLQSDFKVGKPYIENAMQSIGDVGDDYESAKAKVAEIIGSINCSDIFVYLKEGAPFDFSVGLMAKYGNVESIRFGTISEALEFMYLHRGEERKESNTVVEIEKSLEKQKQIVAEIDKEIEENRKMADFIFNNMVQINALISVARSSKHITKEELEEASNFKIKDVNLKDKTFTIVV